jgi:hypothetical protein
MKKIPQVERDDWQPAPAVGVGYGTLTFLLCLAFFAGCLFTAIISTLK